MGYSENFFVGYSNTDKNLKLSDGAVLRMFEDVATMHSEAVGDGMRDSLSRWFLTAYDVRIKKRPVLGERVECITWSRDMRGCSASREFEMRTADGELAVYAVSNWARIDTAKGRLERITPELGERYGTERDRKNFEKPWIPKLKEPTELTETREFYVDRFFIDANNHMNNVCYLDIAKCVLNEDILTRPVNGFEIMYKKAIMYKDTIICGSAAVGNEIYITIKKGDETMAVIKMF